ncbi:exopolysaccharide biosynthesis polyprenyl glycosylphosphotransferase [Caldalkalibacillus uzonensis]|uniref:Exopolysaccharide biosynthesis polyprenyl glycosylphosphotransferase n=1 Tax=Caldalkalibacillus uzonensis TaxID=353224 RepID=A0ABU0CQ09_9BACI|nr:sugar transferase [Caldalkalibacillus uzonensis]MDQ0338503.1 exopolysaccharide biosynthesis polyprenyl glycosylphosphotransferase [Caldalkalibacillus uzonensis]
MRNQYLHNLKKHKFIILMVDLVIIGLAYVLSFSLRYSEIPQRNWDSFLALLPWILLIGLFFLSIYELYQLERKTNWDIVTGVCVAVTFMAFLTMASSFLFREFALPRSIILIASLFMILVLILWKISYRSLVFNRKLSSVLLVGTDDEVKKVISHLKHPLLRATKIKHVQPNTSIEKIDDLLKNVDYVFICPSISKEKKSEIIYHTIEADKIVYVIPTLYELLMTRATITSLDDTMVMSVQPFGLTWDQQLIKRIFDIVLSTVLIVLLSPLLFLVAILIKLEDPKGSIIYKQRRIGLHNKEFTVYKFRSMIEGAEDKTGPTLAAKNDERITKVGKVIRAMRLDELPQLYNVLKGDMSIVGPRPERPVFTKELSRKYNNYSYRSTVKPGITGFAQIMGKYTTDVEDKLRYDLYYIRNYSLWLDLIILLRTIIVLLDKTKSEGEQLETRHINYKQKEDISL